MDDAQLKETVLSNETIFDGKVVHLERWQVRLADGRTAAREVVKHVGAAAVVALDNDGCITLVRQHRVAIGQMTWEIPAGKLDHKDEDPFLCAKRELEEETGLRANSWQLLSSVVTTPGFCTERIAIYLARDLSQHEMHTDADEFLSLARIPLDEAVARVMAGDLFDLKTACGILMAQRVIQAQDAGFAASSIQRRPPANTSHVCK